MIKSFLVTTEKRDAYEAASYIAKQSGMLKELYDDKTIEGLSRYENVQELLNSIKEYVDSTEVEDKSLGSFLQQVALITSVDEDKDTDTDKVTLMTIHMAKGLEYKIVYMVGMEEELFPSQMMLSSRADLEEERRLFYVAITRAKQKLFLSYANTRYRYGRLNMCEPSRFLEEIDAKFMKVSRKVIQSQPQREHTSHYTRSLVAGLKKPETAPAIKKVPAYEAPADFMASDTSNLTAGMKVEHPKFGFGKVMELDTDGANRKAKVMFDNFGEKTLLLSFAKLKIHP